MAKTESIVEVDVETQIADMLTEYWELNGYSKESTKNFISEIADGLRDHALNTEITIIDENDYA